MPHPSPVLTKNEKKKNSTDWLTEPANRGFGLSKDVFFKSVK